MSNLRELAKELLEAKLSKQKNIHLELKELDANAYYEYGGSASVSTTLFRGGKNKYLKAVSKMATDRDYNKMNIREKNRLEFHKELNGGKRTAKITIVTNGDHVYSVETITMLNHY